MDTINYEEFQKLQIRIGRIISVEKVADADKLLKLIIDFGDEQRQIVSGIAEWYKPEDLVGKQIPVLVNLEPRKFKGVESQGMILAVTANDRAIIMHPQIEVPDGAKVR